MTILTRESPSGEVHYPETDGEPMAENTKQYRYLTMIKGGLEVVFRERADVFIAGDLFWYPVEGANAIRVAPDVLVALGRPKGDRSSYLQWREAGIPPQVVFEVLSPGNREDALQEKFQFYQRHEVQEYYTYDPDTGELEGWQRQGPELRPIPQIEGWTSPLLGVRFELDGLHLRLLGPDGRPFATYEDLALERDRAQRERDAEHARAERERQRAEQERQRAEEARKRAERLAARLRELGVDPEA
jgi:Uma2 family endonuclease